MDITEKLKEINSKLLWQRTHYCGDITPELDENEVVLYGWVHRIRDVGKLKFILLRDRSGIIQLVVKKGEISDSEFSQIKKLTPESAIIVKGHVKANPNVKKGVEVLVNDLNIVSLSATPLPLDVTETVPALFDTRYDNRPIDLRKPRNQAIFMVRSILVNALREFFIKNGFIEIHTPKIVAEATEGGANVFRVKYFEYDVYLAQSPQLYKQLMLVAGFDKVFEVAPAYRAEEHNTPRHLNEYISIDAEIAWIKSHEDVMQVLENAVAFAIDEVIKHGKQYLELLEVEVTRPSLPFKRVTYSEALDLLSSEGKEIPFGEDIDTEGERLLGKIMKEKYNVEFYFITEYPEAIRPFYTMLKPEDPRLTRSFDLDYKGLEITTGGQRIHDYDFLVQRIKEKNLNPDSFKFYTKFFKYGVPPHGGFGLGLERFTMQLLNLSNIREATLFPRTRTRVTP
ncbi:MAG: aspartate--tRNA(Asn) ligase [Candidatus Asgardarchaeum sp.]|nr:aspartate--tRNA(Asn) ligase [Candidatus Odinarchaeota archaeon]